MLLPSALLNTLLFRGAARVRLALSTLRLAVPVRPLLFPSLLLPIVVILLLCTLLRAGLVVPLLLLCVFLPAVLFLPLLLLCVLRTVAMILSVLLSMLGFGFGLLVPVLLLFVAVLLFPLLLVLGISRSRNPKKQRQNACAGDSN
jgi:hypothetical protein